MNYELLTINLHWKRLLHKSENIKLTFKINNKIKFHLNARRTQRQTKCSSMSDFRTEGSF